MDGAEALPALRRGQPQSGRLQAPQQFPAGYFRGTGTHRIRAQVLGDVVVIALKAAARDPEPLGEGMEFLEARVAHHVAPLTPLEPPDRFVNEDGHAPQDVTQTVHRATMTPVSAPISGFCEPRFTAVRSAFAANFAERGEVGAAVCIVANGEVVVDLVGGWHDEARTLPWQADTMVNFYSVGKALGATLVLQLVDQGILSLDTRVAEFWPEFAEGGKGAVTVRHALSHQAAVPAIRALLTDEDLFRWDTMAAALAATPAWWPIGTRHAYHTNSYGHLVGEIVHRVTGELPGDRFARLGAGRGLDVWFGVPPEEQHRCAEVIWAPRGALAPSVFDGLEGDLLMSALAHFNPPGYSSIGLVNTPRWRASGIPSTSGHGTARGVAGFYAALIGDDPLLSPALLHEASHPQSVGRCPILDDEMVFGLGFQPTTPRRPFSPGPNSFGHFGTGGAVGLADPDAGVALGYVMNHVIPRWQSSRNRALIDTLYACL